MTRIYFNPTMYLRGKTNRVMVDNRLMQADGFQELSRLESDFAVQRLREQKGRVLARASVSRMVNIDVESTAKLWGDFINRFSRANQGQPRTLGNMGITYVDGSVIETALRKQYPSVFEGRPEPKRVLRLYRDFSGDFNSYSKSQGKNSIEAMNATATDPDELHRWLPRTVELHPQLDYQEETQTIVARLSPEDNASVIEEKHDTLDHLAIDLGLDVRGVDPTEVHLTIFKPHHPLGAVSLRTPVSHPTHIALDEPRARLFENLPPRT